MLAAGKGERLRPLTLRLPKPLLPVGGEAVAGRTLRALARAGVEAAALNLHHLGDAVRDHFGERYAGLPLTYSEEPELLGTSGALPPLAEFFAPADLILIVNGDSLCDWPFEELIRAHQGARVRRGRRRDRVAFGLPGSARVRRWRGSRSARAGRSGVGLSRIALDRSR